MFHYRHSIFFLSLLLACVGCKVEKDFLVTISTPYGKMKAILYDETPQHKENFLKLAQAQEYDSTIFHRVIKEFMIQGGDINLKQPNSIDYTVPAEINDSLFHKKGAIAAARTGDNINPERKSSGCQFYIVQGKKFEEEEMRKMAERQLLQALFPHMRKMMQDPNFTELQTQVVDLQRNGKVQELNQLIIDNKAKLEETYGDIEEVRTFPEEHINVYSTLGGAPHLDGAYTVFGEVIDGLAIIDSVAAQKTARADKPSQDIFLTVDVEEIPKKKIEKLYNYSFEETP